MIFQLTSDEKLENVELEYTCMLTKQLETQRAYFEAKLTSADDRLQKFEKLAQSQVNYIKIKL